MLRKGVYFANDLEAAEDLQEKELPKRLLEDFFISEDFNIEFLLNLIVLWNPRTHRELDDSGYDFSAFVSNRVNVVEDVNLSERPSSEVFDVREQNLADSIEIFQSVVIRKQMAQKTLNCFGFTFFH